MIKIIKSLDGDKKIHTGFWWGKTKQTHHLANPGIDERILKGIIKKPCGMVRTGLIWLRIRPNGRLVITVMNTSVPQNAKNLTTCITISISKRLLLYDTK